MLCCGWLQEGIAGRYLPDCGALISDVPAREGAVCVLRLAQQESKWHLAVALQRFQPLLSSIPSSTAAAAAAHAPSDAPSEAVGGHDADSELDDDELGYSDDEGCQETAFADVEGGSDSDDDSDGAGSDAMD